MQLSGALTNFAEAALLNHLLGGVTYTPPSNIYFACFTSAASDATPGSEPAANTGYERVMVGNSLTSFPSSTAQSKSLNVQLDFNQAVGNQGPIVGIGAFDAATSGHLLARWEFDQPVSVLTGNALSLPAGSLSLVFATGGFSNYVKNAFFNMMFGGVQMSNLANIFFAYLGSANSDVSAGNALTGASRVAVANSTSNFPVVTDGSKQLASEVLWPVATADQGTATHAAIFDAASGGNYLGGWTLPSSLTVNTGVQPKLIANSVTFALD